MGNGKMTARVAKDNRATSGRVAGRAKSVGEMTAKQYREQQVRATMHEYHVARTEAEAQHSVSSSYGDYTRAVEQHLRAGGTVSVNAYKSLSELNQRHVLHDYGERHPHITSYLANQHQRAADTAGTSAVSGRRAAKATTAQRAASSAAAAHDAAARTAEEAATRASAQGQHTAAHTYGTLRAYHTRAAGAEEILSDKSASKAAQTEARRELKLMQTAIKELEGKAAPTEETPLAKAQAQARADSARSYSQAPGQWLRAQQDSTDPHEAYQRAGGSPEALRAHLEHEPTGVLTRMVERLRNEIKATGGQPGRPPSTRDSVKMAQYIADHIAPRATTKATESSSKSVRASSNDRKQRVADVVTRQRGGLVHTDKVNAALAHMSVNESQQMSRGTLPRSRYEFYIGRPVSDAEFAEYRRAAGKAETPTKAAKAAKAAKKRS